MNTLFKISDISLIEDSDKGYQEYLQGRVKENEEEKIAYYNKIEHSEAVKDEMVARDLSEKHGFINEGLAQKWIQQEAHVDTSKVIRYTYENEETQGIEYKELDGLILDSQNNIQKVIEIKSGGIQNYLTLDEKLGIRHELMSLLQPGISALGIYIKSDWVKTDLLKKFNLGFDKDFNALPYIRRRYNEDGYIVDPSLHQLDALEYQLSAIKGNKLFSWGIKNDLLSEEDFALHKELKTLRNEISHKKKWFVYR